MERIHGFLGKAPGLLDLPKSVPRLGRTRVLRAGAVTNNIDLNEAARQVPAISSGWSEWVRSTSGPVENYKRGITSH